MEWVSSPSFDPLCLENDEIFQTPCIHNPTQLLQSEGDQIIPTIPQKDDNDDLDHHLLAQIMPHFSEVDHQQLKAINNHDHHHGQRRKASSRALIDDHTDHPHESNEKKKQRIIHKEIERQRRLEMSSLHASLRSLLPLDFVKGKRSISDHLDMTVKYIRHLEQKIQALSEQREALKLEVCNSNYEVIVNPWNDGDVEVIASTISSSVDGAHRELPLSKVLQCLATQELDVVSCISNRVSNKLVHTIQAQVGDGKNIDIDPVKLQQKLVDVRNFA